ncbi:MAG: AzlD domain-containing protein [Acidimicrobiia bacterium]|nr:AzlD domain-containing protein [Acidimicrobiia bacterium]
MSPWLIVIIVGIGTYLTRLSFIGILGTREVPTYVERPLRLVAPAVIAAIAIPELVAPDGVVHISFDNLRLLAGLIAIVAAWTTRSIGWTIGVGMVSLWILDWLL